MVEAEGAVWAVIFDLLLITQLIIYFYLPVACMNPLTFLRFFFGCKRRGLRTNVYIFPGLDSSITLMAYTM